MRRLACGTASMEAERIGHVCVGACLLSPSFQDALPKEWCCRQRAGLPTNAIKIILYWAGFLPTSSSAKLINTNYHAQGQSSAVS